MESFKSEHMAAMASQVRKRRNSRASTASVHSVSTQPTLDQPFDHSAATVYQTQWLNEQAHPNRGSVPPQLSPEDMLLATQLTGGMTGAHPQVAQTQLQFQQHPSLVSHGGPSDIYNMPHTATHSFSEHDSQMLDRDDQEDLTNPKMPQHKGPRSSANNELEMRQLFQGNKHRSLQDVATELHGNERGPNSERTRQVFAMLWINQVCAKGKGSVPRGRVYANYANKCANERITVLNPASFGKLVRVLFPGLKTRRLGVRGESKYHYVNFMLLEDQVEDKEVPLTQTNPPKNPSPLSQSFTSTAVQPTHVERTLSSPQTQQIESFNTRPYLNFASLQTYSVYNQPNIESYDQVESTASKTTQPLAFEADPGNPPIQSEALVLPNLQPFLPVGTDQDAVKSLTALYRSHCTSLVECIRYCKEKTFFHLFTSFQGTLTMPVQKLFTNPAVAPWIEQCDFLLYQRMMRIISGLTLQVVPKPVLDTFRSISERLVCHIRESFHGQPAHVIQAKEAPATIFAGLLDRALRVNLTAHAAANMLAVPANRDQMYLDWISMVRVRKLAECVPTRAMDDCVNVLLTELRDLLDPTNIPWEIETLTIYGDAALHGGKQANTTSADQSAQTVLDRWVLFFRSLPARFPYASHAAIVNGVQRVGTAVMRDLTINQGKSFGSWWVTKCWVDEMISFMAESGGFMQQASPKVASKAFASQRTIPKITQTFNTRPDSTENPSVSSQPQPDSVPFPASLCNERSSNPNGNEVEPSGPQNADILSLPDTHDDSGIGIRTPEEEFPMDKYTALQTPSGQDLSLSADMSAP